MTGSGATPAGGAAERTSVPATRSRWGCLLRATLGAAILVTLVFALVGFLFLTRGTVVRHVRGVAASGSVLAPAEPEFALSVAVQTGTALSRGNRVELALDGDGTFPRLFQDLAAAQHSISIQSYYGGEGLVATTLQRILLERAAAGVRIAVLYDAFGTAGMADDHRAAFDRAGIAIAAFRPFRLAELHLAPARSHSRGIVIDGRIGWTGGFGIDDKWLGDGRTAGAWRETNVRFEGPAVRQLEAAFAAAWAEATGELIVWRATLDRYPDAVATAGLMNAVPTLGSTAAERLLALSIAGARESLWITNAYFAPDDDFVHLLIGAARRGVDVRLLVGGSGTDVPIARHAGRARYDALLAAGVRIWEWRATTLHAKTFVVDGLWSSVGSMNFDNRSLAVNDETTLLVLDADFGRQMQEMFTADLRDASEVRLADFRRRPWHARAQEWAADLFRRLL